MVSWCRERRKVVGKSKRRTENYEKKPGGKETGMSWEKECHYRLVLRGERLGKLAANLSQLGECCIAVWIASTILDISGDTKFNC